MADDARLTVVPFEPKPGPHIAGEAVCLRCRYQWVAVAPTGTTHLECPSCGTVWGMYRSPVEPKAGDVVWRCDCGCELFALMMSGPLCIQCGVTARDYTYK